MKNYNEDLINQLINDYQPNDIIIQDGVSGVIKYYCEILAKKKDEEFVSYLQAIKESPLEKANVLIEQLLSKYMMKQDADREIQTDHPFTICINGRTVEFKSENEKNPNDPEHDFFTYEEAKKLFGKPDLKDGWRLPTKEEFEVLCKYPYEFKDKQGVFDNRLYLPAAGDRGRDGNVYNVGSDGWYWSSTPDGPDTAWNFNFNSGAIYIYDGLQCCGFSVRLVRDTTMILPILYRHI